MNSERLRPPENSTRLPGWLLGLAICFFIGVTAVSWFRWATFRYQTFDLAFYVQCIWLALHGKSTASILGVSLMGNHAEPIVFLITPLFAIFRHPMVFVVVQNLALATMAPVGYDIARRLGLKREAAGALAAALLLTPATGYAAIHEFHPETLTAPLLLWLWRARLRESFSGWWLWFVAVLATKENMTLLLAALCAVQAVMDRRRGGNWVWKWYALPAFVALGWAAIYGKVLSPLLNPGDVDYVELYSHLGATGSEILRGFFTRPQVALGAFWHALMQGNLVWALVFPLLLLPVLRPHWFLVAAPILLQHLLSWRESEWRIYLHYAAPLIPIFWIAAAEAVSRLPSPFRTGTALAVVAACLIAQGTGGPVRVLAGELGDTPQILARAEEARALLREVPADASVTASIPYLSHLAMRQKIYSLHHVLKGLKTLSRQTYVPPETPDVVFIDFADGATFDAASGYYHPRMRTVDGRIIPSSDRLLHEFLSRDRWQVGGINEFRLFVRGTPVRTLEFRAPSILDKPRRLGTHTLLSAVGIERQDGAEFTADLQWEFEGEREVFPWLILRFDAPGRSFTVTHGLCAPEAGAGLQVERCRFAPPAGEYGVTAVFLDYSKLMALGSGTDLGPAVISQVSLGKIEIRN